MGTALAAGVALLIGAAEAATEGATGADTGAATGADASASGSHRPPGSLGLSFTTWVPGGQFGIPNAALVVSSAVASVTVTKNAEAVGTPSF